MLSFKEKYYDFITAETDAKKIGLFRVFLSIFGGLTVAYLGMACLVFIPYTSLLDLVIVFTLFYTCSWACVALWIVVAASKLIALLRVLIPTIIFSIFLALVK